MKLPWFLQWRLNMFLLFLTYLVVLHAPRQFIEELKEQGENARMVIEALQGRRNEPL